MHTLEIIVWQEQDKVYGVAISRVGRLLLKSKNKTLIPNISELIDELGKGSVIGMATAAGVNYITNNADLH